MKTKVLKNLSTQVYTEKSKDGTKDNFKNRVEVCIVNISGEYDDKDGNKVPFSSNRIRVANIKLDFKSGETKQKVVTGKDGKGYAIADKKEVYFDINQFKDLVNVVTADVVDEAVEDLDLI